MIGVGDRSAGEGIMPPILGDCRVSKTRRLSALSANGVEDSISMSERRRPGPGAPVSLFAVTTPVMTPPSYTPTYCISAFGVWSIYTAQSPHPIRVFQEPNQWMT